MQSPIRPVPLRNERKTPWGLIIGLSAFGLCALGGLALLLFVAALGSPMGGNVALVYVRGAITDSAELSLFGGAGVGSEGIVRRLDKIRKDPSVKAVILRVDSPGGTVAASQDLFDAIQRVRRAGKKVVASMGDVAASGGYYVAASADRIVAQRGTLTGSIGVIMGGFELEGLMKKLGIRDTTIKSGKLKDVGSQFRAMTAEERASLQRTSNEVHDQFIRDVALGRKLPVARVRQIADGSIYTGERAKALGLVDQIGGLHDAVREAGKLAGISGEPRVVRYGGGGGLFDALMSDFSDAARRFNTQSVIRATLRPGLPLPALRVR